MSSIPARMKKIQLKIKTLERSQDFSHYKSMGIFPDAQGQSMVGSSQISTSSKTLCLSSLPAKMKKIRSKMKALGDFSRRPRAANSAVLGLIWLNFELVRDIMDVLVTCKYEEDPIKNEGARVFTALYSNFSHAQGQITLELVVISGQNLNSFKLSCMSLLPARMSMTESKNEGVRVFTRFLLL